jgi:hypothetical protein
MPAAASKDAEPSDAEKVHEQNPGDIPRLVSEFGGKSEHAEADIGPFRSPIRIDTMHLF